MGERRRWLGARVQAILGNVWIIIKRMGLAFWKLVTLPLRILIWLVCAVLRLFWLLWAGIRAGARFVARLPGSVGRGVRWWFGWAHYRLGAALAKAGSVVLLALRWLRRPDEVGQPLTLRPRGVRLLLLLAAGNGLLLLLMGVALYYQATRVPAAVPPATPVVIVVTPAPSPSPGVTPTPFGMGGAVAFTLHRNGNTDIYALNQFDGELVRLTHDPAEDRDPAWSPDGQTLAFASHRAHNWDIYLLDIQSGALIRLTREPGFDAGPAWSPDGQWIAFESYRYHNLDIYVMNRNGRQLRRLTTDPGPDYTPAWSPDGRYLAFVSYREGSRDIYVYPLDGAGEEDVVNITKSPDLDEDHPAWSPDGQQLAFSTGTPSDETVYVGTFDWTAERPSLANTELFGSGSAPGWSPDGESLVLVYDRGGRAYLLAASVSAWALFNEVYSGAEPLGDPAWGAVPLSPQAIARARAAEPGKEPPLYTELLRSVSASGSTYTLIPLPDVNGSDTRESLSDRVNDSFHALRQRILQETGWDYLSILGDSTWALDYMPPGGESRRSWHVCGRAIGLDQSFHDREPQLIELIREEIGNATYWRVFLKTQRQDGSMGEPLRQAPWDLKAREQGGPAATEGGELKAKVPRGYYVDLTALAADYGWERVRANWRWRYHWPDIRWWQLENRQGLTWWECMLEVYEPEEIAASFGPIPELGEE